MNSVVRRHILFLVGARQSKPTWRNITQGSKVWDAILQPAAARWTSDLFDAHYSLRGRRQRPSNSYSHVVANAPRGSRMQKKVLRCYATVSVVWPLSLGMYSFGSSSSNPKAEMRTALPCQSCSADSNLDVMMHIECNQPTRPSVGAKILTQQRRKSGSMTRH